MTSALREQHDPNHGPAQVAASADAQQDPATEELPRIPGSPGPDWADEAPEHQTDG